MTISTSQLQDIIGATLIDNNGDKIGKVDEVYLDRDTREPEWIATHTGFFGTRLSFVPMRDATVEGNDVQVPFASSQVKDAPNIDADGQLSEQEEAQLYAHYNMEYSESDSDSGLPSGGETGQNDFDTEGYDTSGPTTDDAMTRSEEELRVSTQQQETGRARLRKYVVTENRTVNVPVTHEEVRIETEPITEANIGKANAGPDISEEEHEVVLHAEEPVVSTETVAKERVRLATEEVTETRQVDADVRKEKIELDEDADSNR